MTNQGVIKAVLFAFHLRVFGLTDSKLTTLTVDFVPTLWVRAESKAAVLLTLLYIVVHSSIGVP